MAPAGLLQPVAVRAVPRADAAADQRPREKSVRAVAEAAIENPGTPARANPSSTMLPVMLATNTWPRTR